MSLATPIDPDRGPRRTILAMVGLIALFVVVAVAWATIAELDVAVQANGSVVAPSRLQEVQSLEGGIVEQMLVTPGQRVKRGEPVLRLDTVQATSSLSELRQRQLAALAGRARDDALLAGTTPRFDSDWQRDAPELIAKETQLWRDAAATAQASLAAAREGVERRAGEVTEAQARIRELEPALKLAEESFSIEDRLFAQGAGARADFLAAKQRLLTQRAELAGLRESLPRLNAGLAEARATVQQELGRQRAQWGAERSDLQTKASALTAQMEGQQDRVERRELSSPVDGIVNRVLVPTRGGVAMAGKPIVEIVPDEARLQMTARVQPADIGFLHPGQQARVRVQSYDSATFGQMEAQLERVGADAIVDEKGNAYFEVQLTAARGQLKLHGKPLDLSPGMPVDVSILTGRRSVMQYLLKPVLRGVQGALQER